MAPSVRTRNPKPVPPGARLALDGRREKPYHDCSKQRSGPSKMNLNEEIKAQESCAMATSPPISKADAIEQRFLGLAQTWQDAVAHLSSSRKRDNHPAY